MRVLSPLVVLVVLPALGFSACGGSNKISVKRNPDFLAETQIPPSAKGSNACLDPKEVLVGKEYTCPDGKKRTGTLVSLALGKALYACTTDKEKGCLTTAEFSAFSAIDRAKIAPGNVIQGVVIGGVTGTLTTNGPAECASDGEVACVATSAFAAASTSALAAKVVVGQTVAGVAGSAPVRPADCALDGATGCVSTVGFPAVNLSLLTPSVLKSNVAVAGVNGVYPNSSFPLTGATATTDLTSLAATTAAGSYEFFDSAGTRYTGSISDAGSITVGTSAQTFNTSLYRQFTVPGDVDLVAGNISNGVNILGVGGNVVLPAATDVKLNITYGTLGTGLTGSYAGVAVADCTADGNVDCRIPATGALKAADTTNFNGWDIRKKRNSGGAVLTFAGITSQGKSHCRNRANTQTLNGAGPNNGFDNTTTPGVAGLDFFDTIDDWHNNFIGLPGEIPAWTMLIGGSAVTVGSDFACGGIYATGDTATGNTGADSSLAHDPNGNWQDLTPGVLPGGANSTNTANGCNAADKHCVFKELISGLMVTEVSAADYNWANAIDYCHNLGEAGNPAVTSPIPVIGPATYTDWRLPTQKELTQLTNAGSRGLNQTAVLTTFFGGVDRSFWSSSSVSNGTSFAWHVHLNGGHYVNYDAKTGTRRAVCVR
ncbi:MAG: DUF1566 domain-containing protein [Silvanigrellales bacterium]|nr:DUF1566 domain-containing protein [Silvanigrellales bacterium]